MKKLFVLVAIMMVAVAVEVNAAGSKEMKPIASWSRIDFTDTDTPTAGGESVTYTYKWDTKGLIVCKVTVNTVIDPKGLVDDVITTQDVELTLYDSKCKEVGSGTLDDIGAIESNCVYALEGVMNGKVAVISEVPRRVTGATTDRITWYTYQINKAGKELKCLSESPLEATETDSPSPAATYSTENLTFLFGVVIWRDITYTWYASTASMGAHYDTTINETQIYSKPDFKSCLIAGEAIVVAGEASSSVPKIMSLNNSWDSDAHSPIPRPPRDQEIDITIVK